MQGTSTGVHARSLSHTYAAAFNGEKLNPHSPYVAAVWGVLTCKWGILLVLYAEQYSKVCPEHLTSH